MFDAEKLLGIKSNAFIVVLPNLLAVMIVAFIVVFLFNNKYLDNNIINFLQTDRVMTILATTLTFLLGFFQSDALGKHQDGVKDFGPVCGECISIASSIAGYINMNKVTMTKTVQNRLLTIRDLLANIPTVLMRQFAGENPTYNDCGLTLLTAKRQLAEESEDLDVLIAMIVVLTKNIHQLYDVDKALTNPQIGTFSRMLSKVHDAIGAIGGNKTYQPPQLMEQYLQICLVIFFIMLPISIVSDYESYTPLICVIVGFFMIGIYSSAKKISNPFENPEDNPHLEGQVASAAKSTSKYVKAIFEDVLVEQPERSNPTPTMSMDVLSKPTAAFFN